MKIKFLLLLSILCGSIQARSLTDKECYKIRQDICKNDRACYMKKEHLFPKECNAKPQEYRKACLKDLAKYCPNKDKTKKVDFSHCIKKNKPKFTKACRDVMARHGL